MTPSYFQTDPKPLFYIPNATTLWFPWYHCGIKHCGPDLLTFNTMQCNKVILSNLGAPGQDIFEGNKFDLYYPFPDNSSLHDATQC